jgi:ribosomal-protein-serine acetyltransferase
VGRDRLSGFTFVPPGIRDAGSLTGRSFTQDDAQLLYDGVIASQRELIPWMAWARGYQFDMAVAFARYNTVVKGAKVTEVSYVACDDQHPFLGSFGLHARLGPGELEIGYWVDSRSTRRGIGTQMAALLTEAAFTIQGIEAVEIHHDRANHASGGIPRRLGYQRIGSQEREPEAPGEKGVEMLWRMECDDWPTSPGAQLLTSIREGP